MACALHPTAEPLADGLAAPAFAFPRAVPRAMTRCECAGVSFQEVAREVASSGSLEDARRRTGCGQNCSACLPDLLNYLAPTR